MHLTRVGIWPALGAPQWRLVAGGRFTLGRDPACEVVLDDPAVSAFHAELRPGPSGITVRDLGSKNGLVLAGARVGAADLTPNDRLVVGGFRLSFHPVPLAEAEPDEMKELLLPLVSGPPRPELLDTAEAWLAARPDLPAAQSLAALAHLRRGRIEDADRLAGQARLSAPDEPLSLLAVALVSEERGMLQAAEEILAGMERRGGGPAEARPALARVRRKREVYAKVRDLVSLTEGRGPEAPEAAAHMQAGPFSITFQARRHGRLVMGAHAALAQAADRLEQNLGFAPERVEVVFEQRAADEDWAAACYDGSIKVRAPDDKGGDPYFLYVALTHEYVHLAVAQLSASTAPAWLDEGLAQYLTQNPTPADRRALTRAFQAGACLPLAVLEGDFAALEEKALVDLAYAQSYSLAQYLVQRLGWPGIRRLLDRLKRAPAENNPTDWALSVWDLDRERLEEAWLAWLA